MTTVIVPPHPGLCAAVGAMIAEARVDRVRTCYARSDAVIVDELAELERELRQEVLAELRLTVGEATIELERIAAMRYEGQNYELEVPLAEGDLDPKTWTELVARFETAHERQYGFALPGEPVELINLRLTALRPESRPQLLPPTGTGRVRERRHVGFGADRPVECAIYDRSDLPAGHALTGPAVIEEIDSTTVVFPGDLATVHPSGALVIEIGAGG
jgi:N-methylhydantoinase A